LFFRIVSIYKAFSRLFENLIVYFFKFTLMDYENEDFQEKETGKATRRAHRARRVDAMQMWRNGTIDEKPIKERWSREFKNPRLKRLKNPLENFNAEKTVEGLVVEVHRRTCEVRLDSQTVTAIYRATTVGELGEFPAVGDYVVLGESSAGEFCVVRVKKRKSALTRPGPKDSHRRELTLAANVDQVVIVVSLAEPPFNYGFADRFLLAARLNELPCILVLTKTDLVKELPAEVKDFMEIVDKVVFVSSITGEGVDKLSELLAGKVSVFSGQSGVGKTSLINRLVPTASLKTGTVRFKDGKGRHTTTSSSLLDLPSGGIVIDTPGIRALGLLNLEPETLSGIFPGFFPDGRFTCKYSNCLHLEEPGCAVRSAVENGTLSKARLDSYLRILNAKD